MKREKAMKLVFMEVLSISSGGSSDNLSFIIDKIFDEFEKELKEYKEYKAMYEGLCK